MVSWHRGRLLLSADSRKKSRREILPRVPLLRLSDCHVKQNIIVSEKGSTFLIINSQIWAEEILLSVKKKGHLAAL